MSQCAVVDYNPNKCDFSLRLNCLKLMSCRSSGGRSFQTLGPAAEKLLSPKLVFVRGTTHVTFGYLVYRQVVNNNYNQYTTDYSY